MHEVKQEHHKKVGHFVFEIVANIIKNLGLLFSCIFIGLYMYIKLFSMLEQLVFVNSQPELPLWPV